MTRDSKPLIFCPTLLSVAMAASLGGSLPCALSSTAQAAPAPGPQRMAKDAFGNPEQRAPTPASESRFRGSTVTHRTAFSAVSLHRGVDLTYDPHVETAIGLQPRWWLTDTVHVSGELELLGELTHSSVRNDRVYTSDLRVQVAADSIAEIPWLGVGVCAATGATLPTSRPSRAQSQLLVGDASVCLSRRVGPVELRYSVRGSKSWHRYTTGMATAEYVEPEGGPWYFGSEQRTYRGVGRDVVGGVRNVSWTLGNGLTVGLSPTDAVSLSVTAGVATLFLYPLEASTAREGERSNSVNDSVNRRDTAYFNAAASYTPIPLVTASLAVSTYNAQLRPDGQYRRFGFNRLTQVGLSLSMDVAELLWR